MAKKLYAIMDGKTKKIRKNYVVRDSKVKKVRKGYTVIAGKIRPLWTGGELEYFGQATPLSVARYNLAATSVGDYAIFGGGQISTTPFTSGAVDAYNKSLTRTVPAAMTRTRNDLAATAVGNYALFGGGTYYGYVNGSNRWMPVVTVNSYDKSLTSANVADLTLQRTMLAATNVGNYALFGGGYKTYPYPNIAAPNVDAYNESLTRINPTELSDGRYSLGAASVGNYALFGGGDKDTGSSVHYVDTVDAYDESLTRTSPTPLSHARANMATTTVGDYALFCGGSASLDGNYDTYRNLIDAYDTSLTRIMPTLLSQQISIGIVAATVGDFAVIAGFHRLDYYNFPYVVNVYDTSLTRTILNEASERYYVSTRAATAIGDFVLFGGGRWAQLNTSGGTDYVDYAAVDVYTT